MNKPLTFLAGSILLAALAFTGEGQASPLLGKEPPERAGKFDAPTVLCIDSLDGQPSEPAYAKAAANGFRSILTLRGSKNGVDLLRERFLVEKHKMHFFNIPVVSAVPRREQVDEFLRLARDRSNQPMLINCANAERVGAFMMIFRIIEQGWSEDKAIEEAVRSGLKSSALKQFADNYFAQKKLKRG
jgi:protein tyrosine phosphatase (PTP) superfamily phosphohydrolase (DUF442 family)